MSSSAFRSDISLFDLFLIIKEGKNGAKNAGGSGIIREDFCTEAKDAFDELKGFLLEFLTQGVKRLCFSFY